jgi:glycosyltransferase involved in cell wall biosynthesis
MTSPTSSRGQAGQAAPTVSIIIPCYNTAHFVGDTLASVFAQTRTDFEAIVVNDGSSDADALERAVAPYRDRIVYLSQENRGPSAARNTGIRAARGEYVAFLDSDDIWERDYLDVQLAALERDRSIDVLYPDALIFGDSPHAGRRSFELSPSTGEVTFETVVTQECNVFIFATARRDTILRAGMFDESLRSSEDFDLWLRILKAGGRIAYHHKALVRYRRHDGSLSANTIRMCEHILRVLEKAESLPLTESERGAVERERARWRATLQLEIGRQEFLAGNAAGAADNVAEANRYFRRRKLTLVIALLRLAPRLLLRAYRARERLVFRTSTG